MGAYEDTRFKSDSKKPLLQSLDIIGLGSGPELEQKLKYATDVCSGVIFGKELVNAPANVLTPGMPKLDKKFHLIVCVFFNIFCSLNITWFLLLLL